MTKRREEPKVQMVCDKCGSTDVSRDAWADWEVEAQKWVLRTAFDYAHCHTCDGETNIAERPLKKRRTQRRKGAKK